MARTWLSFRARHFRTISASAAARDSTVAPSTLRTRAGASAQDGRKSPNEPPNAVVAEPGYSPGVRFLGGRTWGRSSQRGASARACSPSRRSGSSQARPPSSSVSLSPRRPTCPQVSASSHSTVSSLHCHRSERAYPVRCSPQHQHRHRELHTELLEGSKQRRRDTETDTASNTVRHASPSLPFAPFEPAPLADAGGAARQTQSFRSEAPST